MGVEAGAQVARSRALAVLRIRSRALAVALLPAAVAVVLLAGGSTDHLVGDGWHLARWITSVAALVVLLAAAGIALVVARARPAMSPTVPIAEESALDLYHLVRDLADRLGVPAPSAIALTPDCDSWLEDRTHRTHAPPPPEGGRDEISGVRGLRSPFQGQRRRTAATASPVLVIGSPFLWWMRVGELRAVLAPVVAGTGPSAHPDIAAARRFVRGLDAAVAVAAAPRRDPVSRAALAGVGWVARLLLRSCRVHASEMERGVAAAAAERAQAVDYGLRIVAQEQVGLAYAGWDRLLTRVALPAWRMGRWPARLDAGVVAALTELSRRDRLAEGFTSRLGERPACDLLEEPGLVDEAASLLAARLFHGGPAETGPDWAPVAWHEYPDEVVDRKWRADAARLHRVLDALDARSAHRTPAPVPQDPNAPTLSRVMNHLTTPQPPARETTAREATTATAAAMAKDQYEHENENEHGNAYGGENENAYGGGNDYDANESGDESDYRDADDEPVGSERGEALAAQLSAEVAREEAAAPVGGQQASAGLTGQGPDTALWDEGSLPLFPLQPPRTGRELLADHVTAMVCCAAMDTAGAAPGLDWLDGPSLLLNGERAADLGPKVLTLIETGDPAPLEAWLRTTGVRPEKPVRLV
ncbi:hypothetical protein ACOT81_24665 [Streptomyces sp. WI04-05B]|uniref:hypothetical protein n=1 Tax=Streptomyces TaxID=1883 RepID=UPI0029B82CCC|nr:MULTISPECIES: hypothetical protein [unclassified Streptomyces]MDX2542788.1 hypothetical protein [Streptomyces sp. WI04-05B]MDX2588332.1 hypothetical protein [Streptomyces sp. WI04-05A]